jgi:RNA polymerase sigma factor (sigma-70 family)
MQTCYHKCLQYQRKTEKHRSLTDEQGEDLPIADEQAPIPGEILAEIEQEQMLRVAISELSPRCERMVRMLFFENPPRPYQEIASQLDLATGSIGFIRGRCLGKLKKRLEAMGF